jgi:hypothetical protein
MIPENIRLKNVEDSIKDFIRTGEYWRCLANDYFKDEIWKGVVGWEDKYEISNLARIRTIRRNGNFKNKLQEPYILKQFINDVGYLNVQLRDIGRNKRLKIHRAVAEAFNVNKSPKELVCVNHLDWNKLNNLPHNLEWSTKTDDVRHAFRNKLIGSGEDSYEATITNDIALSIFNDKCKHREAANKYNVSYAMVISIRGGYSWCSVTGLENKVLKRKYKKNDIQ